MTTRLSALLSLLCVLCCSLACGPQQDGEATASDEALCAQAREHFQACFPDQQAQIPDSCDASSAEQLLSRDCASLESQASSSAGKEDGVCNPWFWWLCSSSPAKRDGYTFVLEVSVCQSELCTETLFGEDHSGAQCGQVTLEDANGEPVATDYINDLFPSNRDNRFGEDFRELDVPAGVYTAKLWRRDGSQAVTTQGEPAEITVTLEEDGTVRRSPPFFEILRTEADAIRTCSDLEGTLSSSCDMAPMSDEDTEWGWLVKLEGENAAGTVLDIHRAFFFYEAQAHHYGFRNLRAGDYTLSFVEMDVPSYARKSAGEWTVSDYEEYIERYATGNVISQAITLTEDEIVASQEIERMHLDLEHMTCD